MIGFVSTPVFGFGKAVAGAAISTRHVSQARVSMKISPSMPFMEQPAVLDDETIPGNAGFDPLNLGTVFNFKYMQEAEIKNGRVAMLGVVGWLVQELFTFPFPYFKHLNPVEAHDYFVSTGGMSQILLFTSFLEIFGAFALKETLEGDRMPGYFGLDPLNFCKTPELWFEYRTKEIKNGRLAMIAFGGLYHGFLVSGQGTFEQLSHFKGIPVNILN